jgi:exoribonuclease R
LIAHTADDLQARRRASTIYLPTQRFTLLPQSYSESFSLSPTKICRALTFSARMDNTNGQLTDFTITPSFVRVIRVTYEHVEECLRTSSSSSSPLPSISYVVFSFV